MSNKKENNTKISYKTFLVLCILFAITIFLLLWIIIDKQKLTTQANQSTEETDPAAIGRFYPNVSQPIQIINTTIIVEVPTQKDKCPDYNPKKCTAADALNARISSYTVYCEATKKVYNCT